jgi:hypothetical protein
MIASRPIWRILLLGAAVAIVGVAFFLRGGERRDSPYDLVENGLTIGRWLPEPPPGTKAVVNVCSREDPYVVEANLNAPIFEGPDTEPTLEWLTRVVDFIAAQRQAGRPVFVHCLQGRNRSGAAVTAYLMREHGWTRDEALAYLLSKRPVVHPNPTLMRLLAEWERVGKSPAGS